MTAARRVAVHPAPRAGSAAFAVAALAASLGGLTCARDRGIPPALTRALGRLAITGDGGAGLAYRPASGAYHYRVAAYRARLDGDAATVEVNAGDDGGALRLRPIPGTLTLSRGRARDGAVVYPATDGEAAVVLRPGAIGVKEDIVLLRSRGDRLRFAWEIELAPGAEAHLDERGDVLVQSDGSDGSAGKIAFRLPAPVVRQASGRAVPGAARFELHRTRLTLVAAGLDALAYPITLDPTILVAAAELRAGNDEGGTAFAADRIARQRTAVGVGDWAPTTALPVARTGLTALAYQSRLYAIGGFGTSATAEVSVAALDPDGTVRAWQPTTPLPAPRTGHASVAYGGFVYVLGGSDGSAAVDTAWMAPVRGDGSLGAWVAAGAPFTGRRSNAAAVAWDGTLYLLGGSDGATRRDEVQSAPFLADGTLGAWSAGPKLPSPRARHAAVVWNGGLYVTGGDDGVNLLAGVLYAPIGRTGALGDFLPLADLPSPHADHAALAHGGYLYLLGGCSGAAPCGSTVADVIAAPLAATGTLGPWTTVSSLSAPRAGLAAVAYDARLYVLGGSGANRLAVDDVGVAPLSVGGSLDGWQRNTDLPSSRYGLATVAAQGFVYAIGGCSGAVSCTPAPGKMISEVLMAAVQADGTLGPWTPSTPLPSGRWGHAAVALGGRIYVVGGCTVFQCSANLTDVLVADIDAASGRLGPWRPTTPLPVGRLGHAAAAYNDRLFVIGGCRQGDGRAQCADLFDDVSVAAVNLDGTVGPWSASPNRLPSGRWGHSTTSYAGALYTVGGVGLANTPYLSDALVAPLDNNGGVGAWTATTALPSPRGHHGAAAFNGYLYVVGGCVAGQPDFPCDNQVIDTQVAAMTSDGKLGPWRTGPLLTPGRGRLAATAWNGVLYALGGCATGFCGPALSDVWSTAIDSAPGGIGAWSALGPMPKPRWGHAATTDDSDHLFVLGGLTNLTPSSDVVVASVVGGTLGSWKVTTPFPTARWGSCAVAHGGYLYVVGGDTDAIMPSAVDAVHRAPILPTGEVGAWATATATPTPIADATCTVTDGRLYVIGGNTSVVPSARVWSTTFNTDGSLGAWSATADLPAGRFSHTTVAYGGYLYVIAGDDGFGLVDTVFSAPVRSDGSVGPWSETTRFPRARYGAQALAADGYLYLVGGNSDPNGMLGLTGDALWAPLLDHGRVGDWMATRAYPIDRASEAVVAHDGYLFALGGSTVMSNEVADVLVAALGPPAARGSYSHRVDFSFEVVSLDQITVDGDAARRGRVRLRYRTAPASGIFGAPVDKGVVQPGTPIALRESNVRYAWLGLSFDDGDAATLAPDGVTERDVSRIEWGYTDRCAQVTCPALDDCHGVASCAPATGMCAAPPLPDGTACQGGLCHDGRCTARRGVSGWSCSFGEGAPSGGWLVAGLAALGATWRRGRPSSRARRRSRSRLRHRR